MHAGRAGLDHGLHQLKRVQDAAKTGFGVGDNRRKVIQVPFTPGALDFIGPLEGIVYAPNHSGNGIDRIK